MQTDQEIVMGWDNTNTWAYIIKTDATVLIKVYHSIIDNTGYIKISLQASSLMIRPTLFYI